MFSKCDSHTSGICSIACGLVGAAHCQAHCRPSESAAWGWSLAVCAVTCFPVVTAHSRWAATGALEFWATSFSLYYTCLYFIPSPPGLSSLWQAYQPWGRRWIWDQYLQCCLWQKEHPHPKRFHKNLYWWICWVTLVKPIIFVLLLLLKHYIYFI